MRYRLLGSSGVRVSELALGTALFGVAPTAAEATAFVARAADAGINLIDTANSYGNQPRFDREGVPAAAQRESAEEIVGRAIAGRRDEFVLSTKVSEPVGDGPNDGSYDGGGLSRLHVMRLVERSLRRLRTDHIDIYYAHRPDPLTRIEDTLATFDLLIRQGKIRYYALSNYPGWRLAEAVLTARRLGLHEPVCHQIRYSLSRRDPEREMLPAGRHLGIDTVVFGALGGGLFAGDGRFRRYSGGARWGGPGHSAAELALAEHVVACSERWGTSSAQVALAWALSRPGIASVIVGPESVAEFEELLPAVDLQLGPDRLAELEAPAGPAADAPRPTAGSAPAR